MSDGGADYEPFAPSAQPEPCERCLCGVESGTPLRTTLHRTAWWNLVFALASAVAVLYTLATARFHWSDAEDAADALLTVPTLCAVLQDLRRPAPSRELRCWVAVLTCMYGGGVAVDLAALLAGRWSKAAVRTFTALVDAGSFCMWAQILYLQLRLL